MSGWDDLEGVTQRISTEDTERLLSGGSGIDENPELADVAGILNALRGPTDPTELTGLQSALGAFGAAIGGVRAVGATLSAPVPATTRPIIRRRVTGKAIATIATVTLISAGAAAAAGVVPTPFSSAEPAVSTTTDSIDTLTRATATAAVDTTSAPTAADLAQAPDPTEVDATKSLDDDTAASEAQGPDVNGPAKFGLCTAFEARNKHDNDANPEDGATPAAEPDAVDTALPPPFQALQDAADAAGQTVADFCADAVPGGVAAEPSSEAGNPSATAPGKSNDNPSATAPGKSNDNPSATAPGKSNDNPSATAPGKSNDNPPGPPADPGQGQHSPGQP